MKVFLLNASIYLQRNISKVVSIKDNSSSLRRFQKMNFKLFAVSIIFALIALTGSLYGTLAFVDGIYVQFQSIQIFAFDFA